MLTRQIAFVYNYDIVMGRFGLATEKWHCNKLHVVFRHFYVELENTVCAGNLYKWWLKVIYHCRLSTAVEVIA